MDDLIKDLKEAKERLRPENFNRGGGRAWMISNTGTHSYQEGTGTYTNSTQTRTMLERMESHRIGGTH